MIDVHISFVIDRSGSMGHLSQSTVDGFNQFLKEQQDQEGNAWMSLTLFDDKIDPRYVSWNVKDIPKMTAGTSGKNPYYVGGSTALYDAVGVAIKGAEKWATKNGWFTGKHIVVIQTDGMENASKEWRPLSKLVDLINYKKGEEWEFIFLGTGEGSWLEASNFADSIGSANTIQYKGTTMDNSMAYATVSASTSMLRSTGKTSVDQSWNDSNPVQHTPRKRTAKK